MRTLGPGPQLVHFFGDAIGFMGRDYQASESGSYVNIWLESSLFRLLKVRHPQLPQAPPTTSLSCSGCYVFIVDLNYGNF